MDRVRPQQSKQDPVVVEDDDPVELYHNQENRRKQSLQQDKTVHIVPLSPLRLGQHNKAHKNNNDNGKTKSPRRPSNTTESTRSMSSRTFSDTTDEDETTAIRNLSVQISASQSSSSSKIAAALTETPPAIPTLKSAMEQEVHKSRRALVMAPTLLQRPKTRNLVSAVKPSSTKNGLVVTTTNTDTTSSDSYSIGSTKSRKRRPSSTKTTTAAVAVVPSSSRSVTSISSNHPDNMNFKVFLMLLHPSSKIFELIQLYFNPTTTTIRDVLHMIPTNATEQALGVQEYTALCRSETDFPEEFEIDNLDLLVQNHDDMGKSAQIVRGEVLVAIPKGYSARKIAKLSRKILANPRICKLLKNSDPITVADKKKKRRTKKSCSRRSHKMDHSHKVSVKVVDSPDTQKQVQAYTNMPSPTMSVQQAMKKAASAAAAANAAVQELHLPSHRGGSLLSAAGKKYRYPQGRPSSSSNTIAADCCLSLESPYNKNNRSMDSSMMSTSDCNTSRASDNSYSYATYDGKSQASYSVDESYSTWSKSLDTSFAGAANASMISYQSRMAEAMQSSRRTRMISASAPAPVPRRRNRKRMVRRVAALVVGIVLTVVPYFTDEQGYSMCEGRVDAMLEQPFGMKGLFQFVVIFVVLVKLQYLITMPPSAANNKVSKCPLIKMRASILAESNNKSGGYR